MSEIVSVARSDWEQLSVQAEKKQHSEWVRQEADLLMNELFIGIDDPVSNLSPQHNETPVDVDWREGCHLETIPEPKSWAVELRKSWTPILLKKEGVAEETEYWIPTTSSTPFYRRMLLILGGLVLITPLSFWGSSALRQAARSKSVTAATPLSSLHSPQQSDRAFADYAQKSLAQIESSPKLNDAMNRGTSLSADTVGQLPSPLIPGLNPTTAVPSTTAASSPHSNPTPSKPASQTASKGATPNLNRLGVRVVKPSLQTTAIPEPVQSSPMSTAPSTSSNISSASNPSSLTPAPSTDLPSLAASVSTPALTATSAPMASPANASQKVIGIIELGLQSTLMVSNNGSNLNFKVGDIVTQDGWKLIQIAQGKALLQKGTESKTLTEGQYF